MAPGGRALLLAADPALMYRVPAADALSLALGRLRANTIDRTSHAETVDGAAAWAMSLAIGYATLGAYLDGPLAMHQRAHGHRRADAPALRAWFVDWVRGAGPLPAIRCGAQPYGLLPITAARAFAGTAPATSFRDLLAYQSPTSRGRGTRSLPTAALDPVATDARPSATPAADAIVVGEVLGAVPAPDVVPAPRWRPTTPGPTGRRSSSRRPDRLLHLRATGGAGHGGGPTWQLWRAVRSRDRRHPEPPRCRTRRSRHLHPAAHAWRSSATSSRRSPTISVTAKSHSASSTTASFPARAAPRGHAADPRSASAASTVDGGLGADEVIRLVHTSYEGAAEPVTRS